VSFLRDESGNSEKAVRYSTVTLRLGGADRAAL
jgi:hypothetical protein